MFLVVIESEGNPPEVMLFDKFREANDAYQGIELDKRSQGKSLWEDSVLQEWTSYGDGELTVLDGNSRKG